MTTVDVIVVLVAVVVMTLLMVTQLRRRLTLGPWRAGPPSVRSETIKESAAADVAAIEQDAKLVSPDAPGNHQDDL